MTALEPPLLTRGPDGFSVAPKTTLSNIKSSAWQREMEQAQMNSWFKISNPNPSTTEQSVGRHHGISEPKSFPHETSRFMQRPSTYQDTEPSNPDSRMGVPVSDELISSGPRGDHRAKFPNSVEITVRTHSSALSEVVQHVVGNQSRLTDKSALTTYLRESSDNIAVIFTANDQSTSIRVHLEAMEQGVAVWIALRSDDEKAHAALPKVVAEIEDALEREGLCLYQVVCNGRLLWRGRDLVI